MLNRIWEGIALTGAMMLVVVAGVFFVLAALPHPEPGRAGAPMRVTIPEMSSPPADRPAGRPELPVEPDAGRAEPDAAATAACGAEAGPGERGRAIVDEVVLGRAARGRDRRAALSHFERAARIWERDARRAAAARVREYVAEAYFELAEDKARRFEAVQLAPYAGDGSVGSIQAWASRDLASWLGRKRRALDAAEGAYGKVVLVEVPVWTVKSAARMGQLYRSFADAFPGPLVPGDAPVCDGFVCYEPRMLSAWRQRFFERATLRFEACLELAVSLHVASPAATTCQRELDRLEPGRPRTATLTEPRVPARPGAIGPLRRAPR